MSWPVTIGDLIRDRRLRGRERDLDPSSLPLPGEYPVPDVGKRMRCSACGSRKIHTAPELYPGGVEAMRVATKPRGGLDPAAVPGSGVMDTGPGVHWSCPTRGG